ncbi:MAG: vanadium-dependent haloperoxidase [Chitinophagaceae bacterium]
MKQVILRPANIYAANVKNIFTIYFIATILLLGGCGKSSDKPLQNSGEGTLTSKDDATVATDWYKLQLHLVLRSNPAVANLGASRMFAYSGIALFEAARFERDVSQSLQTSLYQMPVMPATEKNKTYSWVIAANAAMAGITRNLFPALTTAFSASVDSLEKIYRDKFTASMGADIVTRSEAFGDSIAARIINWSGTDLYNHSNDPYTIPVFAGAWIRTPPAFAAAATPYAGNCRTFLYINATGTTGAPPFAYAENPSSDFYKMVNNVYQASKSLTADQKNIALFWNDVGAGTGYTPTGHCISIITQILDSTHASLAAAGIAYAKTGIALWDASIVCWRSKYLYNQIRPVSFVQQHIESPWLPLLTTPAHPEYPAAHAFITSSIMEVMGSMFGDNYGFTDHTYDFRNYPARSYTSFEQASNECGQSRLYGGIHYQPSIDSGHVAGQFIGRAVAALRLSE